jgi:transposase
MKDYITRAQFSTVQRYFSVKTGRPRVYDMFDVLNAVCHILITGSQWRNLPTNYPPYRIVFYHFTRWKKSKVLHTALASLVSKKKSRVLIIDNQSISDSDLPSNRTRSGQELKGYDGHKHRKGRKRCILTDHEGLIHCALYFPANTHDTVCAQRIIEYYRLTPFGKYNTSQVILLGDKGFHSPRIQDWARKHRVQYQPIP